MVYQKISLKYKTVKISATDKEPPGCPDWLLYTASMIPFLTCLAIFSNSSTFVNFNENTSHFYTLSPGNDLISCFGFLNFLNHCFNFFTFSFTSPKKYEKAKPITTKIIEITEFKLNPNPQLSFKTFGIIDKNNPNITENVTV